MSAAASLPLDSHLNAYHASKDFMDVYSGDLTGRPDLIECDIRVLARHMTTIDMPWAQGLLKLRDRLAKTVNLKSTDDLASEAPPKPLSEVGPGDRIAFFKVYEVRENEILLGEDDWHQDFRLSVFRQVKPYPKVFVSTCCKRHNLFGYAYLAAILPAHKMLVKQSIDNALKRPLAH
ncbi:DUF2867 domain-containing protein [Roseibium sp.]|uniref:DUF2867 domain-containing protein n=1 Tax=Roseibium sp. TaxID=1936156 RepID=UPI003B50C8C5